MAINSSNPNDIAGPAGTTVGGVKLPSQKKPKIIPDPNPSSPNHVRGVHIDPAIEGFKGGPSGSFNGTAP